MGNLAKNDYLNKRLKTNTHAQITGVRSAATLIP